MQENVLFVDDEINVLKSVERVFADAEVSFLKADNAKDAMRLLGEKEIAVLVTDNRMPGMSGMDLLTCMRDLSPETVKILMTGHADLTTAIEAINVGEVFRFILKPWDNEALVRTVREGVEHYRLIRSMGSSDESTLLSLAQTIELKDPYTRGHCDRVAGYALLIADCLGLSEETRQHIKHGGWLHDCGKIGVPDAVLNFNGKLNDKEFVTIKQHPVWGARVAREARLPQTVVNIILHHHERFDGEGYPHMLCGAKIPVEARIVTIADVFDALTTKRSYRDPLPRGEALKLMDAMAGHQLDPDLMSIFHGLIAADPGDEPGSNWDRDLMSLASFNEVREKT
jgi:putative nucleotidyltransferase with HDIG domain